MFGFNLIAFVHQNEEQVKSRHDWGRHVDVLLQRLGAIVSAINWIGCSQDRSTGIQSSLNIETGKKKNGSGSFKKTPTVL